MGKRAFPPLPTRPQLVAVYPALFPSLRELAIPDSLPTPLCPLPNLQRYLPILYHLSSPLPPFNRDAENLHRKRIPFTNGWFLTVLLTLFGSKTWTQFWTTTRSFVLCPEKSSLWRRSCLASLKPTTCRKRHQPPCLGEEPYLSEASPASNQGRFISRCTTYKLAYHPVLMAMLTCSHGWGVMNGCPSTSDFMNVPMNISMQSIHDVYRILAVFTNW